MKIFKSQIWHLILLFALMLGLYFMCTNDASILKGEYWGLSTYHWFLIALLTPILHQVYVLICWRSELHHKGITKLYGQKAFKIFKLGFTVLILSRPISILLLSISNMHSIAINTTFSYVLSGILLIPVLYLAYSIKKYFGIDRAFGIDHFYPDKFKNVPMVNKGIFKYTSNGMYVFGFMVLWIPGILLQSKAALLLALFSHIYIWVHYYFTEKPDIKTIYQNNNN